MYVIGDMNCCQVMWIKWDERFWRQMELTMAKKTAYIHFWPEFAYSLTYDGMMWSVCLQYGDDIISRWFLHYRMKEKKKSAFWRFACWYVLKIGRVNVGFGATENHPGLLWARQYARVPADASSNNSLEHMLCMIPSYLLLLLQPAMDDIGIRLWRGFELVDPSGMQFSRTWRR